MTSAQHAGDSNCFPSSEPVSHSRTASGMDLVVLPGHDLTELSLTCRPLPGERVEDTFGRFFGALAEHHAEVVQLTVFGRVDAYTEALRAMQAAGAELSWPVTWVEGSPCAGGALAGIHVQAVCGTTAVETIRHDEVPLGRLFRDGGITYCYLGELAPQDTALPPAEQALHAFENLESTLHSVGMGLDSLVRTWLYLDEILAWYGELNAVRTQFFKERRVFDGLVPASTGIAGRNPRGAALSVQALAVQAEDGSPVAQALASPLQCPAPQYGSSFSRAVELALPGTRRILISGTASIEQSGASTHLGDADRQVAFTMEVAQAILSSRGMDLRNTTRAYAYFKRAQDAPLFERYCQRNGLASLPAIVAESEVCRDDLLFEIELDAAVRR